MRRVCAVVILSCAALEFGARELAGWWGVPMSANPGLSFGLLGAAPGWALALSGAALAVLLGCVLAAGRMGRGLRLALSVMAGGAAANFLQRLLAGAVMDWIPLPFTETFFPGGLRLNLADAEIALGAALLLRATREGPETGRRPPASASSGPEG